MQISTQKIALLPIGDKNEKVRVYNYIREGIYAQHRILNTYMSQMGMLYYLYNRNISNPKYKERVRRIFRNTNSSIFDIDQAKGLGMAGNCGMRVKKDFNTALKNGLAKGERQLPYYKRNYPLMVPGRLFSIYSTEQDNGKTEYFVKFPNHINFKVYLGSYGNYDKQLMTILDRICRSDSNNIKLCDSMVSIEKNKIILHLCYKTMHQSEYKPFPNRVMGVAFGYTKPCVTYIPDIDKTTLIGIKYSDEMICRRVKIQEKRRELSINLWSSRGGRGRNQKLKALERFHNYEKNVRNYYNHHMSKDIVECAVKNKVERIILENVSSNTIDTTPFIHRNWSVYSLMDQIKYKAKRYGIEVEKAPSDTIISTCSVCGTNLDIEIPKDMIWIDSIIISCPECNNQIDLYKNKARNLALRHTPS